MKKTLDTMQKKEKVFINTKRKEWQKISDEHRSLFEKNGDPKTIADFLSTSTFALKAEWVTQALTQAFQDGRYEFIEKATAAARDRRKNNMNINAIKSLMTVIEVDHLVASGQCRTKHDAFNQIAKTDWGWSFDVVKNRYSRWRKKDPEIFIEEKDGCRTISAFPAKIGVGERCFAGRWEMRIYPDRETEISCTIYYPQKT